MPCGKCLACLGRRRDEWAFRLGVEERYSSSSFFLTLTYSDDNVPEAWSDRHGCMLPIFSKRDVQLFLKRLRKKRPHDNLRYFCVSEYGGQFGRPHYHMILFNAVGTQADIHEDCLRAWDLGIVHIGSVTDASIKYVCKYCLAYEDEYKSETPDKPFMLCSRRPGLGYHYINDSTRARFGRNPDSLIGLSGVVHFVPRYIRNKLNPNPNYYDRWKQERKQEERFREQMDKYRKKYGDYDDKMYESGGQSMMNQQILAKIAQVRKNLKL